MDENIRNALLAEEKGMCIDMFDAQFSLPNKTFHKIIQREVTKHGSQENNGATMALSCP